MEELRELIFDYIKTHNTIAGGVIERNGLIAVINGNARFFNLTMLEDEINNLIDEEILAVNENNRLITTQNGFDLIMNS